MWPFYTCPVDDRLARKDQVSEEQAAEHEAAMQAEGHTVMVVPTDLVSEIVKLIARKHPA